jgi:hypothetical protein
MNNVVKLLSVFFVVFIIGCGANLFIGGLVNGAIDFYLVWKDGEAHKCYDYDVFIIRNSVIMALEEMKIPITELGDNKIIAGEKERFKIKIEKIQSNITKLSVRINFMGDKPYAELLYQLVDDHLNTIDFQKPIPQLSPVPKQIIPKQTMPIRRRLFRRNMV